MRVFDASEHNRIANLPDVRPSFEWFEGEVSFDEEVAQTDHYVFLVEDGVAAIFEWSAPGVWQAHSMSAPEMRGSRTIAIGKAMLAWMRDNMGARMIWGQTPLHNRPARMLNRLLGTKSAGRRTHPVTGEGELFVWEAA